MSANLITDGGAEFDSPLWTYSTGARRYQGLQYAGLWYFGLLKSTAQSLSGGQIAQGLALVVGQRYRVLQYVYGSDANSKPLNVTIGYGTGVTVKLHSDFSKGWHLWDWGTFVADGVNGSYTAELADLGPPGLHGWGVDEIIITENHVAILLAYRGVVSVINTLKSKLQDELTTLGANISETALNAPATGDYFNRPKAFPSTTTSQVWIEVFESAFQFEHPYSDTSYVQRAVYNLPLTVRLTFVNNNGWDGEKMMNAMRWYSAAIKRVLVNNSGLTDGDDETRVAYATGVVPTWEIEDKTDLVKKVSVSLQMIVECEETYL